MYLYSDAFFTSYDLSIYEKQIFIAFDKEDTFYDVTRDIVHSTKIIELHENGGELFGWSWAKKAAREKQIATETGVIEES